MGTITIQTTKDYSKFKSLFGNRAVNANHVKELVSSIEKMNLMHYQPVLVTKEFKVIDGQHRIEAAKILKLEIPYTIVPDAKLQTVQMLNSNVKAWSIRDFCLSYAHLGNTDYADLIDFADGYDVPITTAGNLLMGKEHVDGGSTALAIRDGSFSIRQRMNAEETMRRVKEIQPFCVSAEWKSRMFLQALVTLYSKGMKHDLLITQIQAQRKKIHREASSRDYMLILLDIYNKGMKKNRIDLI